MDDRKQLNTTEVYNAMLDPENGRLGGGFSVTASRAGLSIDTTLDQTAVRYEQGFKPFSISIYNQQSNTEKVSLDFMVNPSDITIGQTFVASDAYTREGWLSTLWGKNQPTLLASGTTAAFYVKDLGLTTISRRKSISFRNFMSFLAIFKNNGSYFLSGFQNTDIFSSDPGRVISVLDLIKISYDGAEYIGSFSSLTVEESVEIPFRFTFNFEFIISGLRGDKVDGHLKDDTQNNNVKDIILATSGAYSYEETIQLDRNNNVVAPEYAARSLEPGKESDYSPQYPRPTARTAEDVPGITRLRQDSDNGAQVDLRSLEPRMYAAVKKLGDLYSAKYPGETIDISSGYRTQAQQSIVHPGTIVHAHAGWAVDMDTKKTNVYKRVTEGNPSLLEQAGLSQPLLYAKDPEPWHLQLAGVKIGPPQPKVTGTESH